MAWARELERRSRGGREPPREPLRGERGEFSGRRGRGVFCFWWRGAEQRLPCIVSEVRARERAHSAEAYAVARVLIAAGTYSVRARSYT